MTDAESASPLRLRTASSMASVSLLIWSLTVTRTGFAPWSSCIEISLYDYRSEVMHDRPNARLKLTLVTD